MKITLSIRQIAIIGGCILTILALLWLGGIKYRHEIDRLNVDLYAANTVVNNQTITIGKLQQNVYWSEAAVTHSQASLKQLKEENEYLKKLRIKDVKVISDLKLEVSVLRKQGEYKDTIIEDEPYIDDELIFDTPCDSIFAIRKPQIKYASFKDEWAFCNVVLREDAPSFDFGLAPATMRIFVGYKGVFNTKPVAVVTTPNPYISITKNSTIIVEEKKTLLQRKYPYLIVGFVAGVLLAK